jgi:4-amino-4-deoxy-L-arabinose transferase-like glycosyltransferase
MRARASLAAVPVMLWLVLLLLAAFAVRVAALGRYDLWLDEAISYYIANQPFRGIIAYTASHPWEHPPGYYLLLHGWISLAGNSEFSLRYLSAFGGMLAIALSIALARRWFGDRVGARSGALLAVLVALLMLMQPMALQTAREARMYAWMMALALMSVLSLDRAFRRNRWLDWGLFLCFSGLLVLFHYMGGLLLVAYALFLVIFWRRLPPARIRLAAILAVVFGLAAAWIITQPGPRSMMLGVVGERLHTPLALESFTQVFTHWALGNWAYYISMLPSVLLALLIWTPVVIGVGDMIRAARGPALTASRAPGHGLRQNRAVIAGLVILLLTIPPILRAVVHVVTNERHSALVIGVLMLAAALGLAAILRRSRLAAALLVSALLASNAYLFTRDLGQVSQPFSAATAHVLARAADGEPVVYTHPFDWVQNAYYNRRGLPAHYIPEGLDPATVEGAQAKLGEILKTAPSAWLMLFPSTLQPENVEAAFNALAYPGEKVWFEGGRAAVHYFASHASDAASAEAMPAPGNLTWDEVKLNRWGASAAQAPAGDALRLQFEWQRTAPVTGPALVVLTLVGPDGAVWARRTGASCNGLCPTSAWGDAPVIERQAFEIPADVPPGDYEMRIGWLTADGSPVQGRAADAAVSQVDLPLLKVTVGEPADATVASPPLADEINVEIGPGLALLGVDFDSPTLHAGQSLSLPMQWRVTGPQPGLNLRLTLKQADYTAEIVQPLGPAWYPSQAWRPGRTVRDQSRFSLPGGLPAGDYRATLAVVEADTGQVRGEAELGTVNIVDRLHTFHLPDTGTPVDAEWAGGIRLARAAVPERGAAGAPLTVTFVWQAGEPTPRNWKIFVHLIGADGVPVAQGDAYLLAGEALTSTWRKGEVIVDTHTIDLPPDLPAGEYRVRVGFYDEPTGERLPLADGSDNLVLPSPVIVAAE